jgi:hypothetical protein
LPNTPISNAFRHTQSTHGQYKDKGVGRFSNHFIPVFITYATSVIYVRMPPEIDREKCASNLPESNNIII